MTLSVDVLNCGKRYLPSYAHLAHKCTRNLRTLLVVPSPERKRKADEIGTRCEFVVERLDQQGLQAGVVSATVLPLSHIVIEDEAEENNIVPSMN